MPVLSSQPQLQPSPSSQGWGTGPTALHLLRQCPATKQHWGLGLSVTPMWWQSHAPLRGPTPALVLMKQGS